ncbi:hypothetical protein L227DRAFT_390603 [Lentinus tigrinus ALCF2SS1-6]|uniref:Uncharacterized protein n=1 Tax=Lentinus tigrinus ALCF2SS1-6 TaxID=1328759 RepID=A0A5C2SPR5_9APHY|nr:hypothetical protein L227DRAFT_390603 [Lentinus tigrinus ALCF2SS1-6]
MAALGTATTPRESRVVRYWSGSYSSSRLKSGRSLAVGAREYHAQFGGASPVYAFVCPGLRDQHRHSADIPTESKCGLNVLSWMSLTCSPYSAAAPSTVGRGPLVYVCCGSRTSFFLSKSIYCPVRAWPHVGHNTYGSYTTARIQCGCLCRTVTHGRPRTSAGVEADAGRGKCMVVVRSTVRGPGGCQNACTEAAATARPSRGKAAG